MRSPRRCSPRCPTRSTSAAQLTIAEAAACIQRAGIFIGNDSGLMHLAAASGTPTVGLCGATADRAVEMAPIGRIAEWALAPEPSMDALTVENAYQTCVRLLEQDGGATVAEADHSRTTPDHSRTTYV